VEACLERLAPELRRGDVVLLKASRAVGLDRLVAPLRERLASATVA
jgi:UDP-N-acetylmuramyl pentapeptide synthase